MDCDFERGIAAAHQAVAGRTTPAVHIFRTEVPRERINFYGKDWMISKSLPHKSCVPCVFAEHVRVLSTVSTAPSVLVRCRICSCARSGKQPRCCIGIFQRRPRVDDVEKGVILFVHFVTEVWTV